MYLKIEKLSKSYGTRPVVSGLDLTMEEGEILSLLGPSGCGKTTILRMLAGLTKPGGGHIEVGGRTFYDGRRELPVEERDIGMVFQDYALWPHMTVAQNVAFGLRLRRIARAEIAQRVEELLKLVNLPGMGKRYPYQLSGGQQQRIAVARALATRPRLLLLDEPLSSLDTGLRETMSAELVQLFKRLTITTINVTHDQNEAMSMSDRILVLHEGKAQQLGTPSELYLRPVNTFVGSFMGPANLLAGRLVEMHSEMAQVVLDGATFEDQRLLGMLPQEEVEYQESQPCNVLCRPADLCLHAEPVVCDHPNLLAGTVTFSSFVGGRWRTLIEVGQGQKQSLLAFATTSFALSSPIWVELPPARCLVLAQ
jgi:ABC-type Fe3+/spermidine/putrescine transport system ATPase subunit